MKNIVLLLLCSFVFVFPLCTAEDTGDAKAAAVDAASLKKAEAWCKKMLDCEKKTVAAVKKIKEVKHFKRGAKDLTRIRKNLPDDVKLEGAMRPFFEENLTDAQKQAVRKKAGQFEKLEDELNEELGRIDDMMSRVSVIDDKSEEAYSTITEEASKMSNMFSMLVSVCKDDEDDEDAEFGPGASRGNAESEDDSGASDKAAKKQNRSIIKKKYKKIGPDFFGRDEEEYDPEDARVMLMEMGMSFPAGTSAEYDESTGTLTVANSASEHKYLKELCQKYAKDKKRK